jgi:glycosyltransferase involved in cell wall biosynthesis
MRVAVFHDYLNQFGGAERVLQALFEIFPNADLYTLLYDEKKTLGLFKNKVKKTSFLDNRFVRNHHRLLIPLMPLAAKTMTIGDGYDLIISSSAGYAKGFGHRHRHSHNPYHISYCHSPLRYAWEIDYLKDLPFAPLPLKEFAAKPIAGWLRHWDKRAAGQVNLFIANSEFIAKKIMSYYNREAIVVHPPVDTNIFYHQQPKPKTSNYFLMVGRLLYYKRFDLGIESFNQLKLPLKIVGLGPEFKRLKKLIRAPRIEFTGLIKDNELRNLYNEAQGLIFPQAEDFGLVAAEAQACGLPVIAFNGGGAQEIVENRKTGLFFEQQTATAIAAPVKEFEKLSFDRKYIASRAKRFSKEEFKKKISEILSNNGFFF